MKKLDTKTLILLTFLPLTSFGENQKNTESQQELTFTYEDIYNNSDKKDKSYSHFTPSHECKELAKKIEELMNHTQDVKVHRELYKRIFIYQNSDNRADKKIARGKTDAYPEALFEEFTFAVRTCPLGLPKDFNCELKDGVSSVTLPSAVMLNGTRNACVNGMKPKNIKNNMLGFSRSEKSSDEKSTQWGNFKPNDVDNFVNQGILHSNVSLKK